MADDLKAWSDKAKARMVALAEESKHVVIPSWFSPNVLIPSWFSLNDKSAEQALDKKRATDAAAANARMGLTAKAVKERADLIKVVGQIWKTTPIGAKESQEDYLERIRKPVKSIYRANKKKAPGIERLTKALRDVRRQK